MVAAVVAIAVAADADEMHDSLVVEGETSSKLIF